jgi:hypothetical protein
MQDEEARYTLYGTEGCHLCDEASALLAMAQQHAPGLAWRDVDIAGDDELFERYGWLIPVLRHDDGGELRWPFDGAQLMAFINKRQAAAARRDVPCSGRRPS